MLGNPETDKEAKDSLARTLTHELEHRVSSFDRAQSKINNIYHIKSIAQNYLIGCTAIQGSFIAANQVIDSFNEVPLYVNAVSLVGQALSTIFYYKKQNNNLALKTKIYTNNPEEIRARQAERNTSDGIIHIVFTSNPNSLHALSLQMAEMKAEHEAWKIKNAEETRLREERWRLQDEEQAAWHAKMAQTYASHSVNYDQPNNL